MRDKTLLMQLQALPLDAKILMSQQRIREWYNYFHGDVCVSFSGGKDSTVLAHLVHGLYPDVPLVFANTGLEYPEIQAFARKMGATFVRPKMRFDEVISKYGYPLISKEVAEAIHAARYIVAPKPASLDSTERESLVGSENATTCAAYRDGTESQRTEMGRPEAGRASGRPNRTHTHTHTHSCRSHSQDQTTQGQQVYSACQKGQRKAVTISITGRTGDEKPCSG